jgi:DNA-binding GntR family transcriptional regulator
MVRRIGSETLSEKAYVAIRDSIVRNELLPNEPVSVDGLAQELGISPTPIREALSRLVADGLIRHEPRKGMRVAELSESDVRNTYEVRRLLEPYVTKSAAQRTLGDDVLRAELQGLESLAEDVQSETAHVDHVSQASFQAYSRIDLRLHELLVASIENPILRMLFESLGNLSLRIRCFVEASFARCTRGSVRELNDEHLAILRALVDGRVEDSERLTRTHLDRAEERTLRALREAESTESVS